MARSTRTTPDVTSSSGVDRGPGPSPTTLALVDAAALITFVAVGLRSHRIGAIAEIAVRNAVPLVVMWVAVSVVVGTYRRRDLVSLVLTWVITVPFALLLRTWWVGSPQGGRIGVFITVGLVFTALFLAIGRGLVAVITRDRPVWRRRT